MPVQKGLQQLGKQAWAHLCLGPHHLAVIRSPPGFFLFLSPNNNSPTVPIVTSLFQIPERVIARKDFRLQTELGTEAEWSQSPLTETMLMCLPSTPRMCFTDLKQHGAGSAQDSADTEALHPPAPWHWTYIMDRDASLSLPPPLAVHTASVLASIPT